MAPVARRALATLVSVSLLAQPVVAQAQARGGSSATGSRAADLKKRGDDLLDAKRYAEALAAYDEAYAIDPSPALLYNRGRALQFLGRYPEALDALEQFDAQAPRELLDRLPGLPALLDDLRTRVGTLVLTGTVAGARVLVNDRQIGVTPIGAAVKLDAGHLRVDAFADGYFPFHREVDLPGRSTVTVDLALVSRETSGVLVVRSHLDGTEVSIDQRLSGLAPLEATLLAGNHGVAASHPGYTAANTQIVLRAGETRDVWLDPIAPPSIFSRWWFWTAVGVVIAGGVATYVALTTERSPPSGDFAPGLVHQ